MHPNNLPCISAAQIDCCVLANNHVLDWGYPGLTETLSSLAHAGIHSAGAGEDLAAAQAPALIEVPGKGRIVVVSYGSVSSGIDWNWRARKTRAGVNVLPDLSPATVAAVAQFIAQVKQARDLVVFSIHWGDNWGYAISDEQQRFARRLIDEAGVDIVYGHSSHHVKGIEVYHGKPILYGCGDFINDYEGISGHDSYRGDLSLMYFVTLNSRTGELVRLEMTPMQIKRFRSHYAPRQDARWLAMVLDREGKGLGTGVEQNTAGALSLRWD